MVRLTTYPICVQNSIFLNFLKNEKIISLLFDIVYLFCYQNFVFRYFRRKINNLEIVK